MEDVIIVGAGPAGLTAGLYAARSGLKTKILAGAELGGQLLLTEKIENFPGFLTASGVDLIETIRLQAEKVGAKIVREKAFEVNLSKSPFQIQTETTIYTSKTVILAMGAKARWLGVPDEEKFKGRGISVCATCDGFFYRGKKVVVIGGGASAVYEALLLMKIAKEVTIICRENQLTGDEMLIEQLRKNPNVHILYQTEVIGFTGDKKLQGVILLSQQQKTTLPVDGAFVAIGSDPDSELVCGQVNLDKRGCIKTNSKSGATSKRGVFAAGDVQQSGTRQAILAAASGCLAALSAKEYLLKKKLL